MTTEEAKQQLGKLLDQAVDIRVGIRRLRDDSELPDGLRYALFCALDAQSAAVHKIHMAESYSAEPEGPCDAPEISTLEGEGHD